MARECFVCGEELEGPEDAEKEYLYNSGLCSLECKREYQREYRLKNLREGNCPQCGKPRDRIGYYCRECLDKYRELKERWKAEGRCSQCGKELLPHYPEGKVRQRLLKDTNTCPECQDRSRNSYHFGVGTTTAKLRTGTYDNDKYGPLSGQKWPVLKAREKKRKEKKRKTKESED